MERLEQIGTEEEGNTILPPLSIKRCKYSKYWCLTIYNNDIGTLEQRFKPLCDKGIFGNEICPTTGKKHIQGFLSFKKRVRAIEKFKDLGAHWEICKGNEDDNYNYCSKDKDFSKWGIFFQEWKIIESDLSKEQLEIVDLFKENENPKFGRKIHWFWESKGGWGKSILATYFVDNCNAILVSGAKKDILSGVSSMVSEGNYPKLIIVDIPRCNSDNFSIQAIEMVKNGMFFNEKYESGMCRFPRPHICIFSNEPPDKSKMSDDRWIIKNVRGKEDEENYNKCLL